MERSLSLKWGSVSITGNFRENNEDRLHIDADARFFLVADGMGGQSAGEKASEIAIELIARRLASLIDFDASSPEDVTAGIDQAVSEANSEIMAMGELEASCRNMGTTIAFIVFAKGQFFVGGVGDSRIYQLRGDKLQQITEDHSLTQALVKAGTITPEEALTHRYKNYLYRYLGTKEGGTGTSPARLTPQAGDRFMLCSDGVSEGVKSDGIKQILSEEPEPQIAAEKFVEAAQKGGSKDNITCIVVHVL